MQVVLKTFGYYYFNSNIAVSYTHLDVYKRQIQHLKNLKP